jgi:hypothetical protein
VIVADGQRARVQAHLKTVAEADEGITRQTLPALDAFEQEARLEGGELGERRNRRIEVTCNVEGRFQMRSSLIFHRQQKTHPGGAGDGFWFWNP